MARPKGSGLENDVAFTLRMSKSRKVDFEKRSMTANASMNSYALAKIFDEPLPQKSEEKKLRGRPRSK